MEDDSCLLTGLEDEEHGGSSESGWTMYIGSSIHENDHFNSIGDYSYYTYNKQEQGYDKHRCPIYDDNGNNDDDSDDSMASDASSGPSLHKFPAISEPNLGMDHAISTEKLRKQLIKRDQRRNKIEKKKLELELKTVTAASHVQNGDRSEDNQPFEPGRIGVSQIS